MKYAIRAVISCMLVLGCSPVDSDTGESYPLRECDSATRCWVYMPGWDTWALSYEQAHLESLADSGRLAPLDPPSAGDVCWQPAASALPLCELDLDGALVHGFPVNIAHEMGIDVIESPCANPRPWEFVSWSRNACYGVLDGVAVLLDPDRPIPTTLAL